MMYEFKFPDVGEGVHEGTILQIKAPVGSKISAGDILAVVETDKVVAEIPSSKDGVVKKYGFEEGQVIEVGQTLAYIETEGGSISNSEPVEENANVVGELDVSDGTVLPSSGEGVSDTSHENASIRAESKRGKVLATPLARKIARDRNIDLSNVKGTGPAGRVTKRDLLAMGQTSEVVAPQQVVRSAPLGKTVKLSRQRLTIAKNMNESWQIPTATLHEEIYFEEIAGARKNINSGADYKVSYLPILLKALSLALKKFPEFNSTFDKESNEVTYHEDHNLGVAIDKGNGLFVPVVRGAQNFSISEIGQKVGEYVAKVEDGKISVEDMRGGTISISNYGTEGGIFANPLIMPPQVAIVGLGRIHKKAVVRGDQVVAALVLPVSLVIDHRVIDGALAGKFISYLRDLLENPYKIMMEMV